MPIVDIPIKKTIDLCQHVIPILEDNGYSAGLGLHDLFVSRGTEKLVSKIYPCKNGEQLTVCGDRAIAELLLEHCKPFGEELVIHYNPQS